MDESHPVGRRVRGQQVGQLGLQGADGRVDRHIGHVKAMGYFDSRREDPERQCARWLCHVAVQDRRPERREKMSRTAGAA